MNKIDPIIIGYMAIGAQKVLDQHPEIAAPYGGEKELVAEVLKYAQAADDLASDKMFELQGDFAYEVAEPLGKYIAERMLVRERDMDGAVARKTALLVAECCGQDLEEEQER